MAIFLRDTPISVRVAILCLIPMLALLVFGIKSLIFERSRAVESQTIAEVVRIAPVVSDLVHELQRERGTSAGLIGSGGALFSDTISAYRADTDRALAGFEQALPEVSGPLT
jgi:hypothetical protein